MDDIQLERKIKQAGYDIRWDSATDGLPGGVYALRNGKRHTRSHATLLALAEHLGRVERPVRFVDDRAALDAIIAMHAEERNHFLVRPGSCRVALFERHKYVQLVSVIGSSRATYELRTDGVRRVSSSNLPPMVVAAFRDGVNSSAP